MRMRRRGNARGEPSKTGLSLHFSTCAAFSQLLALLFKPSPCISGYCFLEASFVVDVY